MSHSSMMSESLALDLSGTAHSAAALSAGREENVNYTLDLSDDEADVITVLFSYKDAAEFNLLFLSTNLYIILHRNHRGKVTKSVINVS